MTEPFRYLAVDLGAESGRLLAGGIRGDRFATEEIHRFPNGHVAAGGHLFWDILRLWEEIRTGLAKAGAASGRRIASIGVDAWGVDFGLLAADGTLLGNPFHYRDSRTLGMMEAASRRLSREAMFAATGVQPMHINSVYQLLSMEGTGALDAARTFLNIPDLIQYWMSGEYASEFTIASTTQCMAAREPAWSQEVLRALSVPERLFRPIAAPGSVLADLAPAVASEAGCGPARVVHVASHDTASAVAAVPASEAPFLFLSSGTWSLMGMEVEEAILDPRALACGFTNEGGAGGKRLFLKNISGLWLLQECRREWGLASTDDTYASLLAAAREAEAFSALVFPGDARFLAPGGMPARIQEYCNATHQTVPATKGAIVRCILESLALEYRRTADQLADITGASAPVIHIIGGGSRNRILNQWTADSTGRTVVAGPVEATAIGNLIGQALALGDLATWAEGRALARGTEALGEFLPAGRERWEEAYRRYRRLLAGAES